MADTENYFDQFDEAPKEPNFFDQFDEAPPEPNYFDRFDEEPQTVPNIQSDLVLGNPNPIITKPSELYKDPKWLNAVRGWNAKNEGKPFEGTDEELSQYGLEMMGWFNSNLAMTSVDLGRVNNADDQLKKDFLYMMDTYDSTDYSWGGTGRFFRGILTDPTTYVGLSTFGIGLAAKEGAKIAGKTALRELIKGGLKTGSIAAAESGIVTGTDNAIRQNIEISAGRRDEFSLLESAKSVALGATAGLILGTALDAGVTGVKNSRARAKFKDDVSKPTTEMLEGVMPDAASPTGLRNPDGTPVEMFIPKQEGAFANILGLKVPVTNTGVRGGVKSIYNRATALANDIARLGAKSSDEIVEAVRRASLPRETHSEISRAVQQVADDLHLERGQLIRELLATDDVATKSKLEKELFELDELAIPIQQADDAFGSLAGQDLGARRVGLSLDNGLSVEQIAKDKKISTDEARLVYAATIAKAEAKQLVGRQLREVEEKIHTAVTDRDVGKVLELNAQKRRLKVEALSQTATDRGIYRHAMIALEYFNEWAISNVFTVSTLLINTIPSVLKTLYKPTLNAFVAHGITKGALREITTTYSVMAAHSGSALKAARAAYRYEAALMTRDPLRFLEGGLKTTGRIGGAIRFFPRALNATDEFFTRINYMGYIAGDTAHAAHTSGVAKGLSGKKLDKHIQHEVDKALKLSQETELTAAALSPLIKKGENRGLKGEALEKFVEEGLRKDGDYLTGMTDEGAKIYVEDLLFKRKFGQNTKEGQGVANTVSDLTAGYEGFVQKNPWMKTMGQLFTRTPIRVYEEGIRMTPGLNLIAPRFLADLKGVNGQARQIRAQGDSLVSLALANYVLLQLGKGNLTGAVTTDYDIASELKNTDLPQAYSIRNEDNGTRVIRNFEPFAVPLKIFANAMEAIQDLQYRKETGEDVGGDLTEAWKWATIGYSAIWQSVSDANLFSGIAGIEQLVTDLADAERKESSIQRFLASKVTLPIPNTLIKIGSLSHPEIHDPKTFGQYVNARLASATALNDSANEFFNRHIPLKVDAMGQPATRREALAGFIPLSEITALERKGDVSDDIMYVRRWMFSASMETGVKFRMPFKVSTEGFEGVDLRTELSADGIPYMDKWSEKLRALEPEKILKPIMEQLIAKDVPRGIKGNPAAGVTVVLETLQTLQEAAWLQVMAEDREIVERMRQGMIKDAYIQRGDFDAKHPRAAPAPIIK